jgi:hypothetical protein
MTAAMIWSNTESISAAPWPIVMVFFSPTLAPPTIAFSASFVGDFEPSLDQIPLAPRRHAMRKDRHLPAAGRTYDAGRATESLRTGPGHYLEPRRTMRTEEGFRVENGLLCWVLNPLWLLFSGSVQHDSGKRVYYGLVKPAFWRVHPLTTITAPRFFLRPLPSMQDIEATLCKGVETTLLMI